METLKELQDGLRDLFLSEASKLNFGIYRFLNYANKLIEDFIQNKLPAIIEDTFSQYVPDPKVKEELKPKVFNNIYKFFSRYYQKGQFLPQNRYAIPCNKEEVKLHWITEDQYFVKTGIFFRDYTFKMKNYTITFNIVFARDEIGSNKALKERFFILDNQNPVTHENENLIIRFQYRDLTDEEINHYEVQTGTTKAKQKKINQKTYEKIFEKINDPNLKQLLANQNLLSHINKFTTPKVKDYFIHKNLKDFLTEQLNYFIRLEVINPDLPD